MPSSLLGFKQSGGPMCNILTNAGLLRAIILYQFTVYSRTDVRYVPADTKCPLWKNKTHKNTSNIA